MNRNKIIFTVVLLLLGIFFIITIVYRSGEKSKVVLPPGTHGVKVGEVIQTTNYTYLQVEENDNKFWIAIVKSDTKPGDSVYYSNDYEMKDFVSKELGRTFPSVFFVQDPSNKLVRENNANQPRTPGKGELKRWNDISVEIPKGGKSIADIYSNPGNFGGKEVTVRGVVVRYNAQIMNKNWVHIQDGTEYSGKFDLAVTTSDSVTVGSTVTFKGIIALNKDFGSGYVYDIIMEQARLSETR